MTPLIKDDGGILPAVNIRDRRIFRKMRAEKVI